MSLRLSILRCGRSAARNDFAIQFDFRRCIIVEIRGVLFIEQLKEYLLIVKKLCRRKENFG